MPGSMKSGMGHVDDLATLPTLDDTTLLQHLQARYELAKIYTYIGDILIAVNPYKDMYLYGPQQAAKYADIQMRSQLPAHVFSISDRAYQSMRRNGTNQCCVVSGESGAGKTETTKLLVQHITHLASYKGTTDLHEKIVQVNPLLEAFGNAQTVLNHNSSRFGKYIEMLFSPDGSLLGARIEEYLLEKSRVVSQGLGERNFHIFYYMFAGLSQEQLSNNLLDRPEQHRILEPVERRGVYMSDADYRYNQEMMGKLRKIMNTVGFTNDDVNMIFALLAAILHITDIKFETDVETDGVYIVDERLMEIAAELLGVNAEDLAAALISNITFLRGEKILSLKNVEQAIDGRDALAKALYGRLFGWIVRQVNIILHPDRRLKAQSHIGILDIAGFENFTKNSFEQLCINVANEQLQYYFNQHIFQWELDEYAKEGVKGKSIKFTDNRTLMDFFMERPIGFFSLLDEESKFPQATDVSFLEKLTKQFSKRPFIQRPKGKAECFTIHHYAGPVLYKVEKFLEKNRDTLSYNLNECMKNSESQNICDLFQAQLSETGSLKMNPNTPARSRKSMLLCKAPDFSKQKYASISKKAGKQLKQQYKSRGSTGSSVVDMGSMNTLSLKFRTSLAELMGKLLESEPQFIRCLKPNHEKRCDHIVPELVSQQLKYTGLLETTRIRRQGYPTRLLHATFINRYQFISFPMTAKVPETPKNCSQILTSAGLKEWEMGKTKVFLRYWHTEQLNLCMDREIIHVIMVQKHLRGFLARHRVRQKREVADRERRQVMSFCQTVSNYASTKYDSMRNQKQEDQRRQDRLEEEREAELREKINFQGGHKKPDDKGIYQATPFAMAIKGGNHRVNGRPMSPIPRALSPAPRSVQPPPADYLDGRQRSPLSSPLFNGDIKSRPTIDHGPNSGNMKKSDLWSPNQPEGNFFFGKQQQKSPGSKQFYEKHLKQTLEKFPQDPEVWGKLMYVEKDEIVAKLYLRSDEIVIDGTDDEFDGFLIGLGAFYNPKRDGRTDHIRNHIGRGVQLNKDNKGNLYSTKLTKNDIIVKGYNNPSQHALSQEVVQEMGRLKQDVPMKIFDMHEYKSQIGLEMKKTDFDPWRLQMLSITAFSFIRNTLEDLETPCWAFVIYFDALRKLGDTQTLEDVATLARLKLDKPESIHIRKIWAQLASQFQTLPAETPDPSPTNSFYDGSSIVGPDDSASQVGHTMRTDYAESEAYIDSDSPPNGVSQPKNLHSVLNKKLWSKFNSQRT